MDRTVESASEREYGEKCDEVSNIPESRQSGYAKLNEKISGLLAAGEWVSLTPNPSLPCVIKGIDYRSARYGSHP